MHLWREFFGKKIPPITAKNRRAVRFVAECMAFHFSGNVEGWRAYIRDAETAIVGYTACKILDQDAVYTRELLANYD